MKDDRLTAVVPGLLRDADARNRRDGCYTARMNWEANLPVVSFAFEELTRHSLHPNLNEVEPLLTNSLVMARLMGLKTLVQIGDKDAVNRIVAMLRDPDEGVRWLVRARLRRLTGQKLGPDPAAWEKWWAENKEDFAPR